MTDTAYVSLGSNLGDRRSLLESAVVELASGPGIDLLTVSSLFETEPVGLTEQPLFLNACVCVRTAGTARQLLQGLFAIEDLFLRKRTAPCGRPVAEYCSELACETQVRRLGALAAPCVS